MARIREPKWLKRARTYTGLREIKGARHEKKILDMWKDIRAPFADDETPWCAAFVGSVLEQSGIKSSRSAAARSYEKWGTKLSGPALGAIVVFQRKGGGHVGFATAWKKGYVRVLGGNQSDAVSDVWFRTNNPGLKLLGYRWPSGETLPVAHDEHDDGATAGEGGRVTLMDDEAAGRMGNVTQDTGVRVGAGTTAGGATLSLSDLTDAADRAADVKKNVDTLGVTDVIQQLTGYFTFWLGVAVIVAGVGIVCWRLYKRRQEADEDEIDVT